MSIKHTRQTVTLRFPKEMIEKAKILASIEKRSLNNWIAIQIQKEIDANQIECYGLVSQKSTEQKFTPSDKNLPDKNLERIADSFS